MRCVDGEDEERGSGREHLTEARPLPRQTWSRDATSLLISDALSLARLDAFEATEQLAQL